MVVGLVGLVLASGAIIRNLVVTDWNATIFVAFGEGAPETLAYGEARLPNLEPRSEMGHDGKFFFIQANDPWLADPADNASVLDRPLYRSQRMFFPMLAGGFGLFGPETIVWTMLILNVLALGAGTWLTALVAKEMGGSVWWGLAFGLNVGLVSEMLVGGAGALAMMFVMAAVLAVHRGSAASVAVLLGAAALTREVMLVSAAGLAWWWWRRRDRRGAILIAMVPGVAVVAWAVYLRFRLGWHAGSAQVQELGLPFVGFARAFQLWIQGYAVNLMAGVAIMMLMVLFLRRLRISDWPVAWAAAGFVPVAVLFTRQVWFSYFDITRAVAPLITAFLLVVFAAGRREPYPVSDADTVGASS